MEGFTTSQCSDPLPQAAMETKLGGFFELNKLRGTWAVPKIISTSPARSAVADKLDCIEISSTSKLALDIFSTLKYPELAYSGYCVKVGLSSASKFSFPVVATFLITSGEDHEIYIYNCSCFC